MSAPEHHAVAIIGAGFSGLAAAIRLQKEGVWDVVVLEKADEVGGVWQANRYPGAACDVQSRVYELAAAPNPAWTHRFARQPEIWAYARDVADRFGLRERIRLGTTVEAARWDAGAMRWAITTSRGELTADVLVAAPGGLSAPRIPSIPGLDHFDGPVMHTARWQTDLDVRGKRVAIVGTGASAIQVVPELQPLVAHLTLFQRTAPWVMPRMDREHVSLAHRAFMRMPGLHSAFRRAVYNAREGLGFILRHPRLTRVAEAIARAHLRHQVADADLRRALTPSYRLGCKRIIISDDYYPALAQPNVTLVPHAVARVEPGTVVAADGSRHAADVLVLATGFRVSDMPIAEIVTGRAGETLAEVWGGSPRAHVGTTVAGFPNFFLLGGPNTGLAHNSVLLMMEIQLDHMADALTWMKRKGIAAVEPLPEAQAAFVREVDEAAEGTVWMSGGCRSWYLDANGRNAALWIGSVGGFRKRARFVAEDYRTVSPAVEAEGLA